jgi:3-oxoacyl-[acyl-carrier protein] reductase
MSENLSGRAAMVTGGSRGIGRAMCLALATDGVSVIVHYNTNANAALEVVEQIAQAGGMASALQANLVDPRAIDQLMAEAMQQFGSVDILVNNAGEMTTAPVSEMSDEVWEQTLALNLTAAFRCARACIPLMKERKWGRIINVSSQAAFTGSAKHAHYAAAKAGLLGFTYSLAKEVGEFGITVNAVSPGRILTDMIVEQIPKREAEWLKQTPLQRFGQPEEVAQAIVFLASDRASYITGANLHVNGGLVMG